MYVICIHAIILSSWNRSVSQAIIEMLCAVVLLMVAVVVVRIVWPPLSFGVHQYMRVLLAPILLKELFKEQNIERKRLCHAIRLVIYNKVFMKPTRKKNPKKRVKLLMNGLWPSQKKNDRDRNRHWTWKQQ